MRAFINVPIRVLSGDLVPAQPTEGLRRSAAWFAKQVSPYVDPLGWQIGLPDENRLMVYVDLGYAEWDPRSWSAEVEFKVATGIIERIDVRLG
jgi:hypothetical protein